MTKHKLSRLAELKRLQDEHNKIQRERLKRTDVFAALEYVPTPRQQVFHDATEYDVLYGGAMGGGKTKALVMEGIRACVRYPGIRVGAFRRTYPELKESMLKELATHGFAKTLGAHWAGGDYELRFPNGSLLMFRYAENMMDASRRMGSEFQLLLFDERTLTPADVLTYLESRLRSGNPEVPVLGIRSASNPGGPSHSAAKDRYIKPTEYGQKVVTDASTGRTVRFVPSKLSDNPHLNEEYRTDLMRFPENLRKAYVDGNWNVFEGQMFPEINYDRHVVQPVELPSSWRRYASVDWGFSAPWAVLWGAVDEDRRLWIYREIYESGVEQTDQARKILAAQSPDEHIVAYYADDAMWNTQGDASNIAFKYSEAGVPLTKAGKGPGSRIAGWQRVHTYLEEMPACPMHQAMGWDTCPGLHIFSTCSKLFSELSELPHARTGNPEDADPKAPDHACDALRYMLVNLGGESKFHFFAGEQPASTLVDPNAVNPRPVPYPGTMIGGFPVLGPSGDPWEGLT